MGQFQKGHGGAREGAGRKKKTSTLNGEIFRDQLSEEINKEVVGLAKALIPKALEGDVASWRELMERAFGKPTTPVEFVNPLQIQALSAKAEKIIETIDEYEKTSDEDLDGENDPSAGKRKAGVDSRLPAKKTPTPPIRKILLSPRRKGSIRDTGSTPSTD